MPKPDLITVTVVRREEIAADRADLSVTIEGASLVTGGQALQKAREVASLAGDLARVGILPEDTQLQGVSAQVASGTLIKTSQATYRLRVRCRKLEQLADVLGAITSQKNTAMRQIEWGYPEDELFRDEWLEDCARRAHVRAQRVAAGLGVKLAGVHSFSETFSDSGRTESVPGMVGYAGPEMARRRSEAPLRQEDLGLEVSHVKRVELRVRAEYRVSDYQSEGPDAAGGA